jgi:hypothetical protein
MSKSTYAYVLNCVQGGTGQYRTVQGSTRNGTRQYRSKSNKVQGSTWWYMSVHGLHLRRAAGGEGGGGGRFWCAFEIAALTAPTVASASSHCMHKLVIHPLVLLPAPPLPRPPPLPPAAAAVAAGNAAAGASLPRPQPRVAASHPNPPGPALGRRGGGRRDVNMWRRSGGLGDCLGGDERDWPAKRRLK